MTQEEKQLLLIDLCGRLPYGVKYYLFDIGDIDEKVNLKELSTLVIKAIENGCIIPYLRPMESMTEKETYIFSQDILNEVEARCIHSFGCGEYSLAFTEANDWLNEHHFDYRGLIKKGLAIEAPVDMYTNN